MAQIAEMKTIITSEIWAIYPCFVAFVLQELFGNIKPFIYVKMFFKPKYPVLLVEKEREKQTKKKKTNKILEKESIK